MFEYLFYLFSKAFLLILGVASIGIGLIYWNNNGKVDPLMVLLLFVGAMILTVWNEISKEE